MFETDSGTFGRGWVANIDRAVFWSSGSSSASVLLEDGSRIEFSKSGGVWIASSAESSKEYDGLLVQLDENNVEYRTLGGRVDRFTRQGESYTLALTSSRELSGYQQTFTYGPDLKIATVSDSFGRQISLVWNAGARGAGTLRTVSAPDGTVTTYSYDRESIDPDPAIAGDEYDMLGTERLTSVSILGPGATVPVTTQYHYEDTRPMLFHMLTGITDARGVRFATYAYDGYGRVIREERAGGQEVYAFAYDDVNTTTTVTNPLGKITVYDHSKRRGSSTIDRVIGVPSTNCLGADSVYAYDDNEFVRAITQLGDPTTTADDRTTTFVNNAQGLPVTTVEAAGTLQARTTTTEWHPTLRQPTRIVEPGLTTDFVYDAQGRLVSRTETDTTTQ
jgi:YD repeat-containing protein